VLRSPVFVAYTFVGAAAYAGVFAFISGSSFVLIRVLGVSTGWFGACFAIVVSGFLIGTLVCRRLLPRLGLPRTLRAGTILSAIAGVSGAVLAFAGVHHYAALIVPMSYSFAHGLVFLRAGRRDRGIPRARGAAAGLFGALVMLVAAAVGSWIGVSHDGRRCPSR
jgi:DHA1 family bicyclomycin/chloramphenicol resistance-like MFS transporter